MQTLYSKNQPLLFMKFVLTFPLLLLFVNFSKAQDLYDIDHVTTIELTIETLNWDNVLDEYYANDLGERLLATATINGIPFDSVGIRYKGNATYNPNRSKNPINLKKFKGFILWLMLLLQHLYIGQLLYRKSSIFLLQNTKLR